LQSYSPSNVELGLRNANFWGILDDFLWGRGLLTFGVHNLITPRLAIV